MLCSCGFTFLHCETVLEKNCFKLIRSCFWRHSLLRDVISHDKTNKSVPECFTDLYSPARLCLSPFIMTLTVKKSSTLDSFHSDQKPCLPWHWDRRGLIHEEMRKTRQKKICLSYVLATWDTATPGKTQLFCVVLAFYCIWWMNFWWDLLYWNREWFVINKVCNSKAALHPQTIVFEFHLTQKCGCSLCSNSPRNWRIGTRTGETGCNACPIQYREPIVLRRQKTNLEITRPQPATTQQNVFQKDSSACSAVCMEQQPGRFWSLWQFLSATVHIVSSKGLREALDLTTWQNIFHIDWLLGWGLHMKNKMQLFLNAVRTNRQRFTLALHEIAVRYDGLFPYPCGWHCFCMVRCIIYHANFTRDGFLFWRTKAQVTRVAGSGDDDESNWAWICPRGPPLLECKRPSLLRSYGTCLGNGVSAQWKNTRKPLFWCCFVFRSWKNRHFALQKLTNSRLLALYLAELSGISKSVDGLKNCFLAAADMVRCFLTCINWGNPVLVSCLTSICSEQTDFRGLGCHCD